MPAVTVIIPAHNVEAYLEDAARSVMAQTFSDFELIIVDDASSDQTAAVAARLAAEDPRIRMLRTDANRYRSGALNLGIREARGSFISFLDADDRYRADKLARQVKYLGEHPETAMVYGDFEILAEGADAPYEVRALPSTEGARARLQDAAHGGPTRGIIHGGYIPSCSPLMRASLFATVSLDESLRNMEDFDLWLQIIGSGFSVVRLPGITYTYRRHPNQKSRNSERMKIAAEHIDRKIREGSYLR